MKKTNISGFDLAFTHIGSGIPLVLVHGYPMDHTTWDAVIPFLENDFDLILPDLRGFGQSDVVEGQYTMTDMANDVASLLDHLGLEKAIIAGHSMGGYIALAFANAFPGRISGLGLVATQARSDNPEARQGRYKAVEEIIQNGIGSVAEKMPLKLTSDVRVQAYVRELIASQRPAGLAGALKAMAVRDDTTAFLSTLKIPIVIVHGDADMLVPVERAEEMKVVAPGAMLIMLPGVGHMPMMEAPQSVADGLKSLYAQG